MGWHHSGKSCKLGPLLLPCPRAPACPAQTASVGPVDIGRHCMWNTSSRRRAPRRRSKAICTHADCCLAKLSCTCLWLNKAGAGGDAQAADTCIAC